MPPAEGVALDQARGAGTGLSGLAVTLGSLWTPEHAGFRHN